MIDRASWFPEPRWIRSWYSVSASFVRLALVQQLFERHQRRMEFAELLLAHHLGRATRHLRLEPDAHVNQAVESPERLVVADRCLEHERVQQVPMLRSRHRRALALLYADEPLLLEHFDRLADDAPAHAERRAQLTLVRERRFRRQRLAHDVVDDRRQHSRPESSRPRRRLTVHERVETYRHRAVAAQCPPARRPRRSSRPRAAAAAGAGAKIDHGHPVVRPAEVDEL